MARHGGDPLEHLGEQQRHIERGARFDFALKGGAGAIADAAARRRQLLERRLQADRRQYFHHCARMPASRTTLPHFSDCALIWRANSSGVLPTTTKPRSASFLRASGVPIVFTASACRREITARGVPAGASRPISWSDSRPG